MSTIEKTNVNSEPLFIGPIMVLSDQDMTALKHHALSSAVMGTLFVGFISMISDPNIPILLRMGLMGGALTGLQAILVAASNICVSGVEIWNRYGKPMPWHLCGRCVKKCFEWWVSAHIIKLENGATIWVDEFTSFIIKEGGE